ncbi:delta-lactam-biosynthetic de-N-acetylase [Chengkuizengella axinellae]|uniref:Delta-lactam-biosynthetic de-N-acetylase n=1 Tax=Chengkuizengella axinellae TaxID=3064388 RepID=A0ABT9IZ81_9BACL|nr:delta-lactam-biosynthetic de-N-acetylase [Chengkuizengella sp. 2205SS18-9]MDP5274684.1 delta-lactam-biosynthetic de-N-acetylase [Chengkuizengella sp. 2205SS18-9]
MKRTKIIQSLLYTCVIFGLVLGTSIAESALANTNDAYHFGLKKSRDGRPASISQEGFMELLKTHGAVFLGDTTKKELYLTFDNGYENGNTIQILDVLNEKRVPAIFFVTGQYVKEEPELLKRMVKEGHLIGNHSWGHPDMSTISDDRIEEELDKVQIEVAKVTGQWQMEYMRPPRGIFNDRVLEISSKLGYTNVFWSVAYKDWETNSQKGSKYAYDNVMRQLHPGAVILLHSVSQDNAEALGDIIDDARKQGYTFKRMDELDVKSYQ